MSSKLTPQESFEIFCNNIANGSESLNITDLDDINRLIQNIYSLLEKTEYKNRANNKTIIINAINLRINKEFANLPKKEQPKNFIAALKAKLNRTSANASDIKNYILNSIDLKDQEIHGRKAENTKFVRLKHSHSNILVVCPDDDSKYIELPKNFLQVAQSDNFKISSYPINGNNFKVKIFAKTYPDKNTIHYTPLENTIITIYNNDTSYCYVKDTNNTNLDRITFEKDYFKYHGNQLLLKYHIKKDKKTQAIKLTQPEQSL